MIRLENELNSQQLSAVKTIEGPVIVVAGAGSGKTRVIEYRVLYLVENGIDANSILLLTFTRRAAEEMLTRAARHNPLARSVEGGTFHSFGYRLIREFSAYLNFQGNVTLLDEGDSEEAIHLCAVQLGLYERESIFPQKGTLRKILSMAVNKRLSIKSVLQKEYPKFLNLLPEIERLQNEYAKYKLDKNYVDFDDLLLFAFFLLQEENIQNEITKRYKYIMVDEYQDTNYLQHLITIKLAEKHRNLMIVGDDAQSIYGFRGATFQNMFDIQSHFPEANIIKLETNYRSTQPILDVANAVLDNMTKKYSKILVANNKKFASKPQLRMFKNSEEEASWIANKVKELRDMGFPFHKQGILFRSNSYSVPLNGALSRLGIPYKVYGGKRFTETAHVKDIVAYLKLFLNPRDELAWNRVLNNIAGIGPRTVEKILKEILLYSDLQSIIFKVLLNYQKNQKYNEEMRLFVQAINSALIKINNPAEFYDIILNYYQPILDRKFEDSKQRFNDLKTIGFILSNYSSIERFVIDISMEFPERTVAEVLPASKGEEKPITLSTIHSAKGLEWEVVFIAGLMDGTLPITYSVGDPEDLEEEHRLLYVAITRAKSMLFLTFCHQGSSGGISTLNSLSRFIQPTNVLAKLDQNIRLIPSPTPSPIMDEKSHVMKELDKASLLKKIIDFFK